MKALVVYYTRTGKTKLICEQIAQKLKADIEILDDNVNRQGIIGWLGSGRDAMKEKEVKLTQLRHNPKSYEKIIIATPVWAGKATPAVMTFIKKTDFENKKVYLISTFGGSVGSSIGLMEKAVKENKGNVVKTFGIKTAMVKDDVLKEKSDEFAKEILA